MKKKILFFEPNMVIRTALLDQLIINRDFDVIQSNSLEDVKLHIEQSPVDLLIMGEDGGTHSLSAIMKFVEEIGFTNKILFIKNGDSGEIASFEDFTDNHHIIEKPFRIQFFIKKIDFVLAKISGSSDVSYRIGPFVFFPEKKVIKFNDQPDIELTEKEVSILKCLLSQSIPLRLVVNPCCTTKSLPNLKTSAASNNGSSSVVTKNLSSVHSNLF